MIKQSVRTTIQKMKADLLTPVTIFKRLQGQHKFLLESSTKYEDAGRYSFIGVNPRKTYKGEQQTLMDILHDNDRSYSYEGPLMQTLKQVMPRVSSVTDFPFIGGAVGYVRYGAGTKYLENEALPEVQFHIYDTLIIFDHIKDELTIAHTNIDAEHQQTDISSILKQLQTIQSEDTTSFQLTNMQYEQAGNLQSVKATTTGDAFELYRKLRIQLPGAYLYYMEFDDHTIIGSSKDSFLAVTKNALQAFTKNDEQQVNTKQSLQKVAMNVEGASLLEGQLQPGLHSLDALNAILPPMPIEKSNSSINKKAFGSVIGYIGFNGQIDFTLAEQVLLIEKDTLYAIAEGKQFTALDGILQQLTGGIR